MRKILCLLLSFFMLIGIVRMDILYTGYAEQIDPQSQYEQALQFALEGKYRQACKLFSELEDYRDSQEKAYILSIVDPNSFSDGGKGMVLYKFHDRWGLIDLNSNAVYPAKWDEIGPFNSFGLAPVKSEGLSGYVDTAGDEKISCRWDAVSDFSSDGLCTVAVWKNGYYCFGLYKADGNEFLAAEYRTLGDSHNAAGKSDESVISVPVFRDGRMLVQDSRGLYGLIDNHGGTLGKVRWDSIGEFFDDRAIVAEKGKYGFIDTQGKAVVSPVYEAVRPFSEGLAAVKADGLWMFIDKNDIPVTERIYTEAYSFSDGRADVFLPGTGWQVIDSTGKLDQFVDSSVRKAYAEARTQLDKGNYAAAYDLFIKLDNYKDSSELAELAAKARDEAAAEAKRKQEYAAAEAAEKKQDYAAAYTGYLALGNYLDSSERAAAIRDPGRYALAVKAAMSAKYQLAYTLFTELGDYEDSQEKAYVLSIVDFASLSDRGDGRIAFRFHDKWGLIDLNTNSAYPADWDSIGEFDRFGLARVEKDGQKGYIDASGRQVIPCRWDEVSAFSAEGFCTVAEKKNGQYCFGVFDAEGTKIIPVQWVTLGRSGNEAPGSAKNKIRIFAPEFTAGLILAKDTGGSFGYLDKAGKAVVPCQWYAVSGFSEEGLCTVVKALDGHYYFGLYDTEGQEVTSAQWRSLGRSGNSNWDAKDNTLKLFEPESSDGMFLVQDRKGFGYIDTAGRIVVPCQWDAVSDFSRDGYCTVVRKLNDHYYFGVYSAEGKQVTPAQWRTLGRSGNTDWNGKKNSFHITVPEFSAGRIRVQNGQGLYGYIDTVGSAIVPCQWDAVSGFSSDGLCTVAEWKDSYFGFGLFSSTGNMITEAQWRSMGGSHNKTSGSDKDIISVPEFVNGRMLVQDARGLYGLMDVRGNILGEVRWDSIGDFIEDRAMVAENGKYGFIDTAGNVAVQPVYDEVWPFSEGLAAVRCGGLWQFVNDCGKAVTPLLYSEVCSFADGKADVYQPGKGWQIIDRSGNLDYFLDAGMEEAYAQAVQLMQDGQYARAYEALIYLAGYRDAGALAQDAANARDKEAADQLYDAGDYAGAYDLYALLPETCRTHDADYRTMYDAAEALLGQGSFDEAAEAFMSLGAYENAGSRAIECIRAKADSLLAAEDYQEAENVYALLEDEDKARECVYRHAEQLASSGQYTEAAERYGSILDYQDSREQRYQLGLKALSENRLSEAWSILSEDLEYSDARDAVYRTAVSASEQGLYEISITAFSRVGAYKDALMLLPMDIYVWGSELYDSGDFYRSADVFAALGSFSSAQDHVKQAWYAAAGIALQNGQYDEAYGLFDSLVDYLDSREMARRAAADKLFAAGDYAGAYKKYASLPDTYHTHDAEYRAMYDAAAALYDNGSYSEAADAFRMLGSFEDSEERAGGSAYALASLWLEEGKYADAKAAFAALGSYSDSRTMVKECDYRAAADFCASGKWEEALRAYQAAELQGYRKADSQMNECRLQIAAKMMEDQQYQEAVIWLKEAGNYKNASYLIKKCEEQIAMITAGEYEKEGKYEAASALYEQYGAEEKMRKTAYQAAQIRLSRGDFDAAVSWYEKAGSYDNADQRILAVGEYFYITEQYDHAKLVFAKVKGTGNALQRLYDIGRYYEQAEDYERAADAYLEAGQYEDAQERAAHVQNRIRQLKADALYDAGDYAGAYTVYAELPADNQTHAADYAAKYAEAGELMEAGSYGQAYILYASLGGYEESAAFAAEAAAETLFAAQYYTEAMVLYRELDGKRDVEDRIDACKEAIAAERRMQVRVGSYVSFGTYPQTKEGTDKTPIEWLVLAKEEDRALLISRYALDSQKYNNTSKDITWQGCTLRTWLNDKFLNKAFSDEEQKAIVITDVYNNKDQGNSSWKTNGGSFTKDKVFLLSYMEAGKYFEDDAARKCAPTDYAFEKVISVGNTKINDRKTCNWWLRSPGGKQTYAALITSSGTRWNGLVNSSIYTVRPAMWIDLGSARLKMDDGKVDVDYVESNTDPIELVKKLIREEMRSDRSPMPVYENSINIKSGDYVTFGAYPQTSSGTDSMPIEWLVLEYDAENKKALLISRYGLDAKSYNEKYTNITWEQCTLRTWLNGMFLDRAFSAVERSAILLTKVDNSRSQSYSGWSTSGGEDTQDRIFLLSYAEANRYFGVTKSDSNNADSRARPTEYAIKQGAYTSSSNKTAEGKAAGWWWLRSPGYAQNYAAIVDSDGSLIDDYVRYGDGSVRPAFWLDLSSDLF